MSLRSQYKSNKPLINSILTGGFYFLFTWLSDFNDDAKVLFLILMLFMPGLSFPATTCYFKPDNSAYTDHQVIIHLLFSVLIYHGSVWLFSADGRIKHITAFPGFFGSLFFLLATKLILKKNITFIHSLLTAICSGAAFLLFEVNCEKGVIMGLAIFLWTVINGILLNIEYRKTAKGLKNHMI